MLSLNELKNSLSYDEFTGLFTWISVSPFGKYKKGDIAGSFDKGNGYIRIGLNLESYSAHRLAWLYVHGEIPCIIDHIDGDRTNNRIANLSNGTKLSNSRNQKRNKNNKSGVSGVHWNSNRSKWYATVSVFGKREFIGSFSELDDAISARLNINKKYGFSSTHGVRCE